jgi:predicted ATPase
MRPDFAQNDDPARRLDLMEALLAKAGDESGDAASVMAALMGIDGSARYGALALSPQQRRNRTLAILLDRLTGLARQKPVLWVIEDAHWIDPISRGFT